MYMLNAGCIVRVLVDKTTDLLAVTPELVLKQASGNFYEVADS